MTTNGLELDPADIPDDPSQNVDEHDGTERDGDTEPDASHVDEVDTSVAQVESTDELLERLHAEADTTLTALRGARDLHDAESKRRREALNLEIVKRRAELNTEIAAALDETQRRGRALAAYRRGK